MTEAAVRAGVQERSVRRWVGRGVVTSQVTPDGRRLILARSLPGQGQRHGPVTDRVTVPGQDQDSDRGQGPVTDSGPDRALEQLARESAMVDFLQGQLQQSRDAERELRLLLAQATKTAQLLASPPLLPPASTPSVQARRVWWFPFWRRRV